MSTSHHTQCPVQCLLIIIIVGIQLAGKRVLVLRLSVSVYVAVRLPVRMPVCLSIGLCDCITFIAMMSAIIMVGIVNVNATLPHRQRQRQCHIATLPQCHIDDHHGDDRHV